MSAPDRQDPVQIIASFFRGNWDMPEKFATGLIEELASEGLIITGAQVFNDMLEALCIAQAMIDPENDPPQLTNREALKIICAAIVKAERRS